MISITQGIKVQVNGANEQANWVPAKNAWVATVPAQATPDYEVAILSAGSGGEISKTVSVIVVPLGIAVVLTATTTGSAAVAGVTMTAYHQGVGLANNGVADQAVTDSSGKAVMFLDAGNYNLLFQAQGLQDEIIQTLQVASALVDSDPAGSKLETHVLNDNAGSPVVGARIVVVDIAVSPIEDSLAAVGTTAVDGSWTLNLDPKTYKFVEARPGYDSAIAEVTVIG